jgi:uncharacterized membrane protein
MNSPASPSVSPLSRFGDWFGEAFNLFGREWLTWCLQGLIYSTLPFLPLAIGGGLLFLALAGGSSLPTGGSANGSQWLGPLVVGGTIAMVVGYLLTIALMVYLLAGMIHTATKQLRGEPISVGDIFQIGGAGVALRELGAWLVVGVAVVAGLALFILPGLLLAGLFLFVHPLIVDRRLSIPAALRESVRLCQPHLLGYALWALLSYVVQAVGATVGCGVIATTPLMVLMWMAAYRDAIGEQTPAHFSATTNIAPSEIWPRNQG